MENKFNYKKYLKAILFLGILLLVFNFILNTMSYKSEKELYKMDVEKNLEANQNAEKYCGINPVPNFDLGLNFLNIEDSEDENILWTNITRYVNDWFENPSKFLSLEGQDLPKVGDIKIQDGFIEFPSILDKNQIVKFKYDPQPIGTPGRKVALIFVMHWNGSLKPYDTAVSLARDMILPISTLIHIPAGRISNLGEEKTCPVDYESVSPNIGKTIFNTRQDILDIQFVAKYLKEKLGYEQVGLDTYSIGTLKGALSSLFAPGLFDFGVFHMAANNFTDAVMKGIGTEEIAEKIEENIDMNLLNTMWSTISPGSYGTKLKNLPPKTRIVQAEYDFVFGPKNVDDVNFIFKKNRPDIELDIENVGHSTFGRFPFALTITLEDIKFIYANTLMKEDKKAKLFD